MDEKEIRNRKRRITTVVITVFLLIPFFTFSNKEDSLLSALKNASIDTVKFDLTAKIYTIQIKKGNFSKAKFYIDTLNILAEKIKTKKITATFFQLKANYFYKINHFDSSIYYNYKSIEIAAKIKYYLPLIRCHVNLGNIYNQNSDYQKAISSFQKAEQYSILTKDTFGIISTTLNIGSLYYFINDYKQAKINFLTTIRICEKSPKYKNELANAYNNYATIFLNQMPINLDSAMHYYNLYLQLSTELELENNIALAYYNIAEVYRSKQETAKARENYLLAEKIYREEEDTVGLMKVFLGFADNYILENKNAEALDMLKEGLQYSIQYEMTAHTSDFLKSISTAYYNLGNYKEAIDYYKKGSLLSDSIYNADNSKILYDMQTKYETAEKEKQNKLLEAENIISTKTIKQQQLITYFIIGGLLLTLLLAFFIFRGLKIQRKANAIISKQKEEVTQQKLIVEEHQKEILDSIHYAKRIQNTLLAHKEFVDQYIPNNFIYFNPKDIVSGDFYWATKKENYFYLAICDSTGHGVPGAFMSLLSIGFLSEAINEKHIIEPNKVFDYVRMRLIDSVSKDGQKDGFDGILLQLNLVTKEIKYAAANNAPIQISNGNIIELEKDKMPVGHGERKEDFKLFNITANKGDTLYLYTDGYADQFGGSKGKKYKYKQLNELLANNSNKALTEQAELLSETFNSWKGNLEQVDDVCVVGIRI
ncbi:MAG: SpoIIE family protein phosphatase [Bacteroidetes bacterium]|nr:SpoIIE family protein phosphatase [Bacteroidota bacterium]